VDAPDRLARSRDFVDEMELFNLYCRVRYYARDLTRPAPVLAELDDSD